MNLILIGGSGFVSGTIARRALAAGWNVSCITRGNRPLADGIQGYTADRHDDDAFAAAAGAALEGFGGSADLVADVIPFAPEDAEQDIRVFSGHAKAFAFISTDFVYDPARRRFPQREDDADYLTDGYGGKKRQAEERLLAAGTGDLPWTVFRPGHIYGPGSLLGCLPPIGRDADLPKKLLAGESIPLVGGGHFLQQPIFVEDLADLVLALPAHPEAVGRILNAAGPDIVESKTYYEIIASVLGTTLTAEEVPVAAYLAENPGRASFMCHRFYDLSALRATGLPAPATSLAEGLRRHVESTTGSA